MSTFFGGLVIGVGKRPIEQSVNDIDPRSLKEAKTNSALTDLADVCVEVLSIKDDLCGLVEKYGKSVENWIKQGSQRDSAEVMKKNLQIDARTFYWVAFHVYTRDKAIQDPMVRWDEPTIAKQWDVPRDQQFAAGHLTELSLGIGIKPVLNDSKDKLVWMELFDGALKTHMVSLLLFSREIYDQYVISRPGFFQEFFKSFDPMCRYQSIPWYHTYNEFVRILEFIVAVDPEAVRLVPDATHQYGSNIFKLYHPRLASKGNNPDPEILKKLACINPEVLKVNTPVINKAIQNFVWMETILLRRPEAIQWIQDRVKLAFLERMSRMVPAISKYLHQSVLDQIRDNRETHRVLVHTT